MHFGSSPVGRHPARKFNYFPWGERGTVHRLPRPRSHSSMAFMHNSTAGSGKPGLRRNTSASRIQETTRCSFLGSSDSASSGRPLVRCAKQQPTRLTLKRVLQQVGWHADNAKGAEQVSNGNIASNSRTKIHESLGFFSSCRGVP